MQNNIELNHLALNVDHSTTDYFFAIAIWATLNV